MAGSAELSRPAGGPMRRSLAIWAGATLLLAGCADSPPMAPGATQDHGVPGAVVSVETGVLYYPACGNEVLWDGAAWYPFSPSNLDEYPSDPIPAWAHASGRPDAASDSGVSAVAYVPAVVAPGPGDDKGTLVTYAGALAYWESNSGDLSTWLTRHEITYGWVC
ncbi:hypothetical protein [Demequina capsici]|uniref:Uncharacterized protein n=1 Tax=Demequina capsici TaxID=3075620 RepID=A0AA96JDF1_9MICO|nr:hypothetical protein [Demequina sp. OYTSA14]WNM24704.1 hypothetical protein RN606_00720 [Demequina sp. OYTSA14]